MTLGRMTQDGIELTEYLCEHLGKRKVILVAHSFGTILGLRMIREKPDRFFAYVGTGQVADARLEKAEVELRWPELEQESRESFGSMRSRSPASR